LSSLTIVADFLEQADSGIFLERGQQQLDFDQAA